MSGACVVWCVSHVAMTLSVCVSASAYVCLCVSCPVLRKMRMDLANTTPHTMTVTQSEIYTRARGQLNSSACVAYVSGLYGMVYLFPLYMVYLVCRSSVYLSFCLSVCLSGSSRDALRGDSQSMERRKGSRKS